jgi:hypothetical protein
MIYGIIMVIFKPVSAKILFTGLALLAYMNTIRATEPDTLKIEPSKPTQYDSITVISHVTIPNCCAPYDSVICELISDTIIGLLIYHTEVSPACDCYGTCMDTVHLGKYNPGNYRLICAQAFVDTNVTLAYYKVNDMYFAVFENTGYNLTINAGKSIKVYPVPATDLIYIVNIAGIYNYEIIDLTGRICLSGILRNNRIEISELENGTYILRIKDNNSVIAKEKIEIRRN